MKSSWIIPGLLSCAVVGLSLPAPPALAQGDSTTPLMAQSLSGTLSSWSFQATQRKLEFQTTQGVQPRAQLISNPTRLVVDLPGIKLGRPSVSQALSGHFRSLRLGQFTSTTARIVVEVDPGYTINPNQVQFQGVHPGHWIVQLPEPIRIPPDATEPWNTPTARSSQGSLGQGQIWRAPAASSSSGQDRLSQIRGSWGNSTGTVELESIDLTANGSQLRMRGSSTLAYTSGWDRATGAYRISVAARVKDGIRLPPSGGNSPFLQVQLRQEGDNAVLLLFPAPSTRIRQLSLANPRELVLDMGSSQMAQQPRSSGSSSATPDPIQIPVPPPQQASMPRTVVPPISNPSRPVNSRYVVVIDPGHGGPDPGAIGIGGIREKDIVIDISRQVASRLQQQGIGVVMTRYDDRDVGLEPRVQIASRANATIFVSIHANAISMSRPEVNGVETYYYSSSQSARLAQIIHRQLLSSTGSRDRKVRSARFYVLRRTTMPAVLVEVGFVTGREDAPRLATGNYRTLLADSIARGILEYLQIYR